MRQTQYTAVSSARGKGSHIDAALRKQHAWLDAISVHALQATDGDRRSELAQAFRYHWRAHSLAAERCVYWLLEGHLETKHLVHESRDAHERISRMLDGLERIAPDSDAWHTAAVALSEAVRAHIDDEESGLLPTMRLMFDRDESEGLGRLYGRMCAEGPRRSSARQAA